MSIEESLLSRQKKTRKKGLHRSPATEFQKGNTIGNRFEKGNTVGHRFEIGNIPWNKGLGLKDLSMNPLLNSLDNRGLGSPG